MKVNGACHCGIITVEGEADPEKVTICHCIDCQTSTGSAFRVTVTVPGDTFAITGQPTIYLKTTAESGTPRLHSAPARPTRAAKADVVALVAALGHRARCGAEIREARLMRQPAAPIYKAAAPLRR
jgi:Glutathione-dependent formaldehyde-activating enzyme